MPASVIVHTVIDSPVGPLMLGAAGDALCLCGFANHEKSAPRALRRLERLTGQAAREGTSPVIAEAARQLGDYFAGRRKRFDLPLKPIGTNFQRAVWRALQAIPHGETISYRQLAERIGHPRAMRAVGLANGANPLAVVIPCHRVIAADGSLGGFGGGPDVKRRLLALEGVLVS